MTPPTLLASLAARGIALRADAGRLLATPVAALTAEDRQALLAHKPALLDLLAAPILPPHPLQHLSPDDFAFPDPVLSRKGAAPIASEDGAITAALDREAAEGIDPFSGPSSWLFAPYQGVGIRADTSGPRSARRGEPVPGAAGELDVRCGGSAAWVGWLRENKRGRWRVVAEGATWKEAWGSLLRVGTLAKRAERIVKRAGAKP